MRLFAALSLAISAALGVFAWWGISTVQGRARFDEMDGLYPLGAGALAVLLVLVVLVVLGLNLMFRRRR